MLHLKCEKGLGKRNVSILRKGYTPRCRPTTCLPHPPCNPGPWEACLSLFPGLYFFVWSPSPWSYVLDGWTRDFSSISLRLYWDKSLRFTFHQLFSRASLLISPASLNSSWTVFLFLTNHVGSMDEQQSILGNLGVEVISSQWKGYPNIISDYASGYFLLKAATFPSMRLSHFQSP